MPTDFFLYYFFPYKTVVRSICMCGNDFPLYSDILLLFSLYWRRDFGRILQSVGAINEFWQKCIRAALCLCGFASGTCSFRPETYSRTIGIHTAARRRARSFLDKNFFRQNVHVHSLASALHSQEPPALQRSLLAERLSTNQTTSLVSVVVIALLVVFAHLCRDELPVAKFAWKYLSGSAVGTFRT